MLFVRHFIPVVLFAAIFFVVSPPVARAATRSVPSQYATIQAGINAAVNGDTVLVADGTYTGTGNRDIDFMGKNITVASVNGASKTIIDCGGSGGSTYHRGFYLHRNEASAVVSGFTIQNGYMNYVDDSSGSGEGGGICIEGASATVQNCVIINNVDYRGGGGVYARTAAGNVTFTNCNIITNSDEGIDTENDGTGSFTFNNCIIGGNSSTAFGAGIINSNKSTGTITLTHCTVSGNDSAGAAGGIDNTNFSSGMIKVQDCVISQNGSQGDASGVSNYNQGNGAIALTNCRIDGNNGGGGCVFNGNGSSGSAAITLTNCTICNTTAFPGNSSIDNENYGNGTRIELTNVLAYDYFIVLSGGKEITNEPDTTANAIVRYSDIEGGYDGDHNISADPLFVNTSPIQSGGDFHLQKGSPCIGKGIAMEGVTTDLDGLTRPNPPSIGAYEYDVLSHLWTATAIATGPDGKTRVLWNSSVGAMTLWTLNADGSPASYSPTFDLGSYDLGGYAAKALSVGLDNAAHVLWTKDNGVAWVWTFQANGSAPSYSPYLSPSAGWTAQSIATSSDGRTHVLWTNANGAMTLWTLNGSGTPIYGPIYGPYTGWTAKAIATGSINSMHVLWTNTNGAMTLWTVPTSGSPTYSPVYGPYSGWSAVSLSVDSANAAHVLWDNASGAMTLWTVPASGSPSYSPTFGPYAGWGAVELSVGTSNNSHILWDNMDGRMTPWTLNASNQFVGSFPTYGPY